MINCPNCGGDVKLPVAAVPTASCAYCSSLLVVNEEAVRSLGQYALLTNPPSCLAVGWPGSLLKRHFTTMGRAQLSYKDGLWDEWWVAFDQNYRAWISQDEGGYILEKPVNPEEPIPSYKSLSPGDVITIGGINLQVEEKREAELVGAQGALPCQVIPGEKFRFVELSDGEKKCTIEYFPDGSHEVFVGKTLGPEDLKSSPKPP